MIEAANSQQLQHFCTECRENILTFLEICSCEVARSDIKIAVTVSVDATP